MIYTIHIVCRCMQPIVGCWSITIFINDKPISFQYEKILFEKIRKYIRQAFLFVSHSEHFMGIFMLLLFIIYIEKSSNALYRTISIYWEYIIKEDLNYLKHSVEIWKKCRRNTDDPLDSIQN